MKKMGMPTVSGGVAKLGGMQLAIDMADDPLGAARDFIENLVLDEGDGIFIEGSRSMLGATPVLFIGQVTLALLSAAGGLGGVPVTKPGSVRCKAAGCDYLNTHPFYDLHNLPQCQNPALPPHTLKVF
jgi:hypothetical protein